MSAEDRNILQLMSGAASVSDNQYYFPSALGLNAMQRLPHQ